jgi:hypothetical protein
VTLLWTVPVLAAAAATALVAVAARAVGDELAGLARDVRRLGELRRSLAAVRAQAADGEALAVAHRGRGGGSPGGPAPTG